MSRGKFWGTFPTALQFEKKLPEFKRIFSAVCKRKLSIIVKTALYVVKRQTENFFYRKFFQKYFCTRKESLPDVGWTFFCMLVETAFLVSEEITEGIMFFRIKIDFQTFVYLRRDILSKFLRPSPYVSSRTHWERKFSVKKVAESFWTFGMKTLDQS